jgi:hypothetical protein
MPTDPYAKTRNQAAKQADEDMRRITKSVSIFQEQGHISILLYFRMEAAASRERPGRDRAD